QREELRVAVTPCGWVGNGNRAKVRNFARGETCVAGQIIGSLIQGGVPHEILDRAVLLKPGAVEVAPILNTDQVGNLDRVKRAGAVAVVYSGRDGFVDGNQLVERHLKEPLLRVGFHPWGGEVHSQKGAQALFDSGRVLRRCNGTANPEKGELAVKRK